MKILVLDNYDSFTYNLVQILKQTTGSVVDVYRNDAIEMEAIDAYDRIVLSPGPGIPSEAGILLPLIHKYADRKRILGVCLGHQAIGEAFGAKLVNLSEVFHGLATPLDILDEKVPVLSGLSQGNLVGRYHSWVVDEAEFPNCLEITAKSREGFIMAIRHRKFDLTGLQFHPESVLTENGVGMIKNWLAFGAYKN